MALTSVDPPELLRFIRKEYPDVNLMKPEKTMFQLIVEYGYPPTRRARYCCGELKERGGTGRIVVTGIRWEESLKRSQRKMVESCYKDVTKKYLNPIVDWKSVDVWEYIKDNHLPYPSLYDEGLKRIGCIGCPNRDKGRRIDFKRWPKFEKAYRNSFAKAIITRKRKNLKNEKNFVDADTMWKWWMEENSKEDDTTWSLFE
jgi:phosphoadenosine phosphosulfate reductase